MIDEHEVTQLLRAATDDIAVPPPPARQLATAGNRRRRRRRVLVGVAAATSAAAVAVGLPVALQSHQSRPTVPPASTTPYTPAAPCVSPVPSGLLPVWARTGFSDPRPRIPFVRSDHGDIVAILFAQPLTAPPSADHNNKILWAARVVDGSSLTITAKLLGGTATATRVVQGGPGPSIIDLPKAGCWQLTLQWAGRTDTMDLAYLTP